MMTVARKGLSDSNPSPLHQHSKHKNTSCYRPWPWKKGTSLLSNKFKHGNPHRWFAVGTCGYFRGKSIEPAEGRQTSQRLIGHTCTFKKLGGNTSLSGTGWYLLDLLRFNEKKNLLLSKVLSPQNYSSVFQLKTNKQKKQIKL